MRYPKFKIGDLIINTFTLEDYQVQKINDIQAHISPKDESPYYSYVIQGVAFYTSNIDRTHVKINKIELKNSGIYTFISINDTILKMRYYPEAIEDFEYVKNTNLRDVDIENVIGSAKRQLNIDLNDVEIKYIKQLLKGNHV